MCSMLTDYVNKEHIKNAKVGKRRVKAKNYCKHFLLGLLITGIRFRSFLKICTQSESHKTEAEMSEYRLLVVSSRARNKVAIFNSVLPNLVLVDYNYETTTLEELLDKMVKSLGGTRVASLGFVVHTSERELFICGPGPAYISLKALINDPNLKEFLIGVAKNVLDLVR